MSENSSSSLHVHHSPAQGDIKLPLTQDEDSYMSRAFYWLRSFYIPTSPHLLLETQHKMFKHFVKQPVEHKRFILSSGDFLNYVDIKSGDNLLNNNIERVHPNSIKNHPGAINDTKSENTKSKKPTLILMHGYGSGLAMFFGKYKCLKFHFHSYFS